MPNANIDLIERAIRYAEDKHKDQKRKDGSPYIIHPLAVAEVVLEMGLDMDAVLGALLHDCIEDTDASFDDIAKHFKEKLNCVVRYNNLNKNINKLAVCSGSGSDYLSLAKEMGCDALLTGDASHHSFLDADEMGIVLFACGHFETEMIAIKPLLEKINNEFDVECVLALQSTPIMTI